MVQNAVTYKRKKPQTIKKTPRIIKVIEKLVPLLCALPYIYMLLLCRCRTVVLWLLGIA